MLLSNNENTGLAPFHSDNQGQMWTSRMVWNMSVFKYTYPGIPDETIEVEERKKLVRQHLFDNYFSNIPKVG